MVITKLQCLLWVLGALCGLVYGYIEGWKAAMRHVDNFITGRG